MSEGESEGDPFAANAADATRLVREVQNLGFEAARTVAGRFCELFTQFAAGGSGAGKPRQGDGGASTSGGAGASGSGAPFRLWGSDTSRQALRADMQRAADSYLSVMSQMNEAGLRLFDATRWWQEGSPTEQTDDLRLPDAAPGGRVSARLWLHNTTPSPAVGLRPWCPGLTNPGGTTLPTNTVTCSPERIDRLDPDASAEVVVTAAVVDDAAAGVYHGQLLVDGLADVLFPLRLQVLPATNVS